MAKKKQLQRNKIRKRKHNAKRRKFLGTSERPRLVVFRSLKNISAQIIDDIKEKTLISSSTMEKAILSKVKQGGNMAAAAEVGKQLAEKALKKNIKQVVFDRAGLRYHGRIKSLAEAARKAGLEF